MNTRNIINGIKRNWDRPYFYRMRITEKLVAPIHRRLYDGKGIDIMEQDWDNLLILDACRADLFVDAAESLQFDGTLTTKYSQGSGSVEFLKSNFLRESYQDTVYVTANPFVKTELEDSFHAVDHVWVDGWDNDVGTVRPEVMKERAKAATEKYPHKRMIVHFMQPHYPFIGEIPLESDGLNMLRSKAQDRDTGEYEDRDVWARLHDGDITKKNVWEAYKSNLDLVLESVTELVQVLPGLTVITSDHGNALDERAWPLPIRIFGHPNGIHIDALRIIPWFECETESRREITADVGERSGQVDENINDRLAALGYR